jgi:SAM-dependent methyltransferase
MITKRCNYCAAILSPLDYADEFAAKPLLECKGCGHIQISKIPTEFELSEYYSNTYSDYRGQYVDKSYVSIMQKRAEAQYKFMECHWTHPPSRVCDYGAGYGYLVERFNQAGTASFGYESDGECIRQAQGRGLDIRQSPVSLDDADFKAAELLCMSHVLEHLPDPLNFLQQLSAVVNFIFIEIPMYSADCSEQFEDQEGHLNFYTQKSFKAMISKLPELEIIAIERSGPDLNFFWSNKLLNRFSKRIRRKLTNDWFFDQYGSNTKGIWLRALIKVNGEGSF